MTLTTLALDGTPIESLALKVSDLTGWADIPRRTYGQVQPPLRPGLLFLSSGSATEARSIGLTLDVQAASFAERQETLNTLLARFAGMVEVTSADHPGRVTYGYLESATTKGLWKAFGHPGVVTELRLVCPDPLWYDLEPVVVAIPAGTRETIPMGTGPVRRLTIVVEGAATNPVLILRDATGTEVQRMTLTTTLTSSSFLTIDCDRYTITATVSGVTGDSALDLLDATETFLLLRPPGPYTLECSAAPLLVTLYRSYVA